MPEFASTEERKKYYQQKALERLQETPSTTRLELGKESVTPTFAESPELDFASVTPTTLSDTTTQTQKATETVSTIPETVTPTAEVTTEKPISEKTAAELTPDDYAQTLSDIQAATTEFTNFASAYQTQINALQDLYTSNINQYTENYANLYNQFTTQSTGQQIDLQNEQLKKDIDGLVQAYRSGYFPDKNEFDKQLQRVISNYKTGAVTTQAQQQVTPELVSQNNLNQALIKSVPDYDLTKTKQDLLGATVSTDGTKTVNLRDGVNVVLDQVGNIDSSRTDLSSMNLEDISMILYMQDKAMAEDQFAQEMQMYSARSEKLQNFYNLQLEQNKTMYNKLLDEKEIEERKIESANFYALELEKVTLSQQRSDINTAMAETLEYVKARNHAMGIDDASTGPVILAKTLKQFTDELNLLERESNLRQQEITNDYILNMEQLSNEYEQLEIQYRNDQNTLLQQYYEDSSNLEDSVLLSNKEKNETISNLDRDFLSQMQQIEAQRAEAKLKAEESAFERNLTLMKEYADQQGIQYTIAGNELIARTDENGMPIPTVDALEKQAKLELSMKDIEKEYSEALGYFVMFDESGNMAFLTDDNGSPMAYRPDRSVVDTGASALKGYLVNKYGEAIPDANGNIQRVVTKTSGGSGGTGGISQSDLLEVDSAVSKIMGYPANKYGHPLYLDEETGQPISLSGETSIADLISSLEQQETTSISNVQGSVQGANTNIQLSK